ncbi:MAG: hypothetical protein RI894_1661 [Bacteroidota bacterium]|jgi:trigger factor
MTTFVRNEVDGLNVELICTVPKSDFEKPVKKEMLRIQSRAVIKGFRPGKAPMSMISKMYEKNIIYQTATKQLETDFNEYLQSNIGPYLAEPLLVDSNFSQSTLEQTSDLTFTYEIGLIPTYPLRGADASTVATYYELDVKDSMLDVEVNNLRTRFGQRSDSDTIDATSVIKANLMELNDDDTAKEGGVVKEQSSFFINRMETAVQALFIGKAIADSVVIENVNDLESEMDADHIKSWVLGLDSDIEVGNRFSLIITEIKSMQPAALDTALYEKAFGEDSEITDEAGLRTFLAKSLKASYQNASMQLLLSSVYSTLIKENQFPIPEIFLRKYLKSLDDKQTDEDLDNRWEGIIADVRWSLIKSKIVQEERINITENDLVESLRNEVVSYFGQYASEQLVETTVSQFLSNKEEMGKRYESLVFNRVLMTIANKVTVNTELISREVFAEKIETLKKISEEAKIEA